MTSVRLSSNRLCSWPKGHNSVGGLCSSWVVAFYVNNSHFYRRKPRKKIWDLGGKIHKPDRPKRAFKVGRLATWEVRGIVFDHPRPMTCLPWRGHGCIISTTNYSTRYTVVCYFECAWANKTKFFIFSLHNPIAHKTPSAPSMTINNNKDECLQRAPSNKSAAQACLYMRRWTVQTFDDLLSEL